jgi:HAD domain in Swiss Army Knife RNA repair proteins
MKIIFLDIDGVLQPYNTTGRFQLNLKELNPMLAKKFNDEDYLKFNHFDTGAVYADWHPVALTYLRQLCEKTKAKIVVSSDWRFYHNLQQMRLLFKIHDLDEFILDIIPLIGDDEKSKGRTTEVYEYILAHPEIKNFVVIDDIEFLFPQAFPENFVKCRGHMTEPEYEKALKILRRRKPPIVNKPIIPPPRKSIFG